MAQLVSKCKSLFDSRSQSRRVGEMPSDLTSSDYTQTTSGVLFPANRHPVSDMQLATQESYAIDICIPWLQVLHPAPTLLAKAIYRTSGQKGYSLCRVLERGCSSATLGASPKRAHNKWLGGSTLLQRVIKMRPVQSLLAQSHLLFARQFRYACVSCLKACLFLHKP